jgi:hypothetical protein
LFKILSGTDRVFLRFSKRQVYLNLKNSCLAAAVLFVSVFYVKADSLATPVLAGKEVRPEHPFEFLPEMNAHADISRFFFQKNPKFEKRYFLESDIFLEPVWMSYRDFFYLITSFESNLGMGTKRFVNVLFDPSDINWAITTTFEFRPRLCLIQFGEDHRCFHEIDREPYPTVYWNMLYLAAGSHIMRPEEYGRSVLARGEWSFASRFSWYARCGIYVKSLFGWVKDSNIDFENYRTNEFMLKAGYSIFSWRNMVVSAKSGAVAGWWDGPARYGDDDRLYWRLTNGLEVSVHNGQSAFSVFADFFLDDIPEYPDRKWFGRDRLMETGISFSM